MALRLRSTVDREGSLLAAIMGSENVYRVYISGTEFMVQAWPNSNSQSTPGQSPGGESPGELRHGVPTMFFSGDNIMLAWLDAMAHAVGKARDELNEDLHLDRVHWFPHNPPGAEGATTTTPFEE
jgi:hypothetical protein